MIVKAHEERGRIEKEVRNAKQSADFFNIDYGAFFVGIKYCDEHQPKCGLCPIKNLCKKNIRFRAY
mgnify:CR=1 FL=1